MGSYQFDKELRHISDAKGSKPYNRKREVFCSSGQLYFLDKTDDFHEGRFHIAAEKDDILIFSFIGMESKEVLIKDASFLEVCYRKKRRHRMKW